MDHEATRNSADLTREELYALVWQRPLNRVGPEFGLDGPRLAKLCAKRQVPYPPPGYWQKKAVGRAPSPTPLPAEEAPKAKPSPTRTKHLSTSAKGHPPKSEKRPPVAGSARLIRLASNTADTDLDEGLDTLGNLHPKIKTWIEEHTREQRERAQEYRRLGNILWYRHRLLQDLTARDLYRFRASSTLCRAVEMAGGQVKKADVHGKLTFAVSQRDVECVIKERMVRTTKPSGGSEKSWTAFPHDYNSSLAPSGFLRGQISTWLPGKQAQWVESPTKPFAKLIPEIVAAVVASVPLLNEWERKREEERRRYQEEEHRRWELRRLKEIDDTRWAHLRSAAANWREKKELDDFIAELEARYASEGNETVGEHTISEWLDWTRRRAAELNPLSDGLVGLFRNLQ